MTSCLQVDSLTPASDVCLHWTLNIYISLHIFRISIYNIRVLLLLLFNLLEEVQTCLDIIIYEG